MLRPRRGHCARTLVHTVAREMEGVVLEEHESERKRRQGGTREISGG
jgi:hypothetical protein